MSRWVENASVLVKISFRLRRLMDVEELPFDLDLSPENIQWNSIRVCWSYLTNFQFCACLDWQSWLLNAETSWKRWVTLLNFLDGLLALEIFPENIMKKAIYLEEFPFTSSRTGSVITVYERHEVSFEMLKYIKEIYVYQCKSRLMSSIRCVIVYVKTIIQRLTIRLPMKFYEFLNFSLTNQI